MTKLLALLWKGWDWLKLRWNWCWSDGPLPRIIRLLAALAAIVSAIILIWPLIWPPTPPPPEPELAVIIMPETRGGYTAHVNNESEMYVSLELDATVERDDGSSCRRRFWQATDPIAPGASASYSFDSIVGDLPCPFTDCVAVTYRYLWAGSDQWETGRAACPQLD